MVAESKISNQTVMNSVWSKFTGGFVSFLKHVWSPMKDTEAAASAIEAWSSKIENWASCLTGFYCTTAIAIAIVSVQVQTELPLMFHFLYLFVLLGFSSLVLAEFGKFKSLMPTQILRCLSLFSLMLAFFLAISIPFPLYFKLISLIVFLVVLSLIFYFATIVCT